MSGFNRKSNTNPLTTVPREKFIAHGLKLDADASRFSASRDADSPHRYIHRFTDADGTAYLFIAKGRKYNEQGKSSPFGKFTAGHPAIVDGASVALTVSGQSISGTDDTVAHIVIAAEAIA